MSKKASKNDAAPKDKQAHPTQTLTLDGFIAKYLIKQPGSIKDSFRLFYISKAAAYQANYKQAFIDFRKESS